MDVQDPIRDRGSFSLDDVRRMGNVKGLYALVDTSAVMLGGGLAWCRLLKRRSPAARYEFEVKVPDLGAGSYRADEVLGFSFTRKGVMS